MCRLGYRLVCHFFVLTTFWRHLSVIYYWTHALSATWNLFVEQKTPTRTRIRQQRIASRRVSIWSQPVQMCRGRGYGFWESSLSAAKFPVRQWPAKRKTNPILSMLQKRVQANPLTLFLVSVFPWTGCYFLVFVSSDRVSMQFAFTKTLRGIDPSEISSLPWKLKPSYNKRTFKIRGYKNQIWVQGLLAVFNNFFPIALFNFSPLRRRRGITTRLKM